MANLAIPALGLALWLVALGNAQAALATGKG